MRHFLFSLATIMILIGCMDTAPKSVSSESILKLVGRFHEVTPHHYQFTWPGSNIAFRLSGREARVTLNTNERVRFLLDVNGQKRDLWLEPGSHEYTLLQVERPDDFTISLTRLTESFSIVTELQGLPIIDGSFLAPPREAARKLLVIGDSITAGYGNEGPDQHCSYTKETSNQHLTYAAISARALNADLHTIAWSGIGVWRTYGETVPVQDNMLDRNARTLADSDFPRWDPKSFQPKAVLVNLGTNDFWQDGAADPYYMQMTEFVKILRGDYPNAEIYLIASPMLSGTPRQTQVEILQQISNEQKIKFVDLGKIQYADGLGCDYHPNLITHERMGKKLTERLKKDLGW